MRAFSKDDIPADWRALLGDYFESSDWKKLEQNLQSVLDFDPQDMFLLLPSPHGIWQQTP